MERLGFISSLVVIGKKKKKTKTQTTHPHIISKTAFLELLGFEKFLKSHHLFYCALYIITLLGAGSVPAMAFILPVKADL